MARRRANGEGNLRKRRPSGDGMVRKREDGRWEGRIVIGHKANGDSIFRYIYADTQKELTAKLRQNIDIYQGIDLTEQSRMPLSEWLDQWLEQDGRHSPPQHSGTLPEGPHKSCEALPRSKAAHSSDSR